jgi:hypothetical protein
MQAIQPTVTPLRPVKTPPRATPRRSNSSSRQRSYPHQTLAAETGVKLAVNLVLSVCATSALIQLWPHYRAVQEKLHEIHRYFDPSLAKTVMQEQSNRVDPQQRPVILQEPEAPDSEESTSQP